MKTLREKLQKTLEDALLGKVWRSTDRRAKSGRIIMAELDYQNADLFNDGYVCVNVRLDTGRFVEVDIDRPLHLQGISRK